MLLRRAILYFQSMIVLNNQKVRASPRGVLVNVMDCDTVISEFKLQLHFQTNTLGMNPP